MSTLSPLLSTLLPPLPLTSSRPEAPTLEGPGLTFSTTEYASQTTPTGSGAPSEGAAPGLFSSPWIPIVMIGAIMWFVVIGPERKQRKQRETMLSALKKGDRVMSNSGLFGSVTDVRETVVLLQIADGVRVKMARSSIQTIIEKDAETDGE